MDFNAIYETIKPYLNIGTLATVIGVVIGIVVKIRSMVNDIKTNSDLTVLFQKALPKDLTVSISKLAKGEIDRLVGEVQGVFIKGLEQNTLLVKDLAKAIASLKSIPDSLKNEIAKHIEDYTPETTESIKLEMSEELVEISKETEKVPQIYVD